MNLVPLRDDELIILRGPKTFDPQELTRVIEPLGFTAYISTRFAAVEYELKQLVIKKGVSYVWRLVHLQEAVLPPGPAQRSGLLKMLDGMLAKLVPIHEFVIVDPYLLPKTKMASYLTELVSLLSPIACAVPKIFLVTSRHYDGQLLQNLQASLTKSCPNCRLIHKVSNRYHDRFWIADLERGLFVGTSLNGIGCHYAMADYMDVNDVKMVITDLKDNGLLSDK